MKDCPTQMRIRLSVLEPVSVEIIDESYKHAGHAGARDGGGHYVLNIVSRQFTGMNTVVRHRMIYSALGDLMKREIHALTVVAHTPNELK